MGSPENETGRLDVEGPQHTVFIAAPFALAKFAVTVEEFAAFTASSGYSPGSWCKIWDGNAWNENCGSFSNPGFAQTGDHPAVCVSWDDARAYAAWLSGITGETYRLPTEAEWEYAARAGTVTAYWWGASASPRHANWNHRSDHCRTVPVASFEPNPWGLYQMAGNIWEWVEDVYAPDYSAASHCGAAHEAAQESALRVLRGGSWLNGPRGIRSARRHAARPDYRRGDIGFRLAKTL
jgi:formylglycine-generating enzyme required for sulfatase activity